VVTAWALAPSHKIRVLSTFYCEYRTWTEIEMGKGGDYQGWSQAWNNFRQPKHWLAPPSTPVPNGNVLMRLNMQAQQRSCVPVAPIGAKK
jgi:hypothetical protein